LNPLRLLSGLRRGTGVPNGSFACSRKTCSGPGRSRVSKTSVRHWLNSNTLTRRTLEAAW